MKFAAHLIISLSVLLLAVVATHREHSEDDLNGEQCLSVSSFDRKKYRTGYWCRVIPLSLLGRIPKK